MQQKTTLGNLITEQTNAKCAEKNITEKQNELNIAIQTAKLLRLESVGSSKEMVYDLEVEDAHEYFANGILVHNCDALRYAVHTHFSKPKLIFEAW